MTIQVGDKVILIPNGRGGHTAEKIIPPGVGDKTLLIPNGRGGYTAIKMSVPSTGDKVIAFEERGKIILYPGWEAVECPLWCDTDGINIYTTSAFRNLDGSRTYKQTSLTKWNCTDLSIVSRIPLDDWYEYPLNISGDYLYMFKYMWSKNFYIEKVDKSTLNILSSTYIPMGTSYGNFPGKIGFHIEGEYFYHYHFTTPGVGASAYLIMKRALSDYSLIGSRYVIDWHTPYVHAGGLTIGDAELKCIYDRLDNEINRHDTTTLNKITPDINIGYCLNDIESLDGFYYATTADNKILKITPTFTIAKEITGLGQPWGICGAGNSIYVVDLGGHLTRYNTDLELITTRRTPVYP